MWCTCASMSRCLIRAMDCFRVSLSVGRKVSSSWPMALGLLTIKWAIWSFRLFRDCTAGEQKEKSRITFECTQLWTLLSILVWHAFHYIIHYVHNIQQQKALYSKYITKCIRMSIMQQLLLYQTTQCSRIIWEAFCFANIALQQYTEYIIQLHNIV